MLKRNTTEKPKKPHPNSRHFVLIFETPQTSEYHLDDWSTQR